MGDKKKILIGDLKPGEEVSLRLEGGNAAEVWDDKINEISQLPALAPLDLLPFFYLVREQIPVGGLAMVGWLNEELPGMTIQPAASQTRYVNFMVAKLSYGRQRDPTMDTNTKVEIEDKIKGRTRVDE